MHRYISLYLNVAGPTIDEMGENLKALNYTDSVINFKDYFTDLMESTYSKTLSSPDTVLYEFDYTMTVPSSGLAFEITN